MKTTIQIKGIHCESCKKLLEGVIKEEVKRVKSVNVDFKTGRTEIESDGELDIKSLKREVESLGLYKLK